MKKVGILLLLVLVNYCQADFAGGELESVQPKAKLISYASSDASALDVNQTSWAAVVDWEDLPKKANRLEVMFYVYDTNVNGPNDTTFSYEFYVAKYGCNAQKVAAGTATCGAAQLSHNPISFAELNDGDPNSLYCWVDTLGTITTDWKDGDVDPQNDGGLNDIASFNFDRQSAKKAWCRIYSMSRATMTVYCVAYYY